VLIDASVDGASADWRNCVARGVGRTDARKMLAATFAGAYIGAD
jgi:hypothetical protein